MSTSGNRIKEFDALASGFLITTVTQSMIPEANREGEPTFAGILYMGGLSLYALMSLTAR